VTVISQQAVSTLKSSKKAGHNEETSLHPRMTQRKSRDVYLVIGGNGFLGRHIVQQLLDRGDIVSVFDIVERYKDVSFYSGDITDRDSVASALRKVCLNIVYYYLQITHP
jgi:putative NADH-flavin reductase